MTREPALLAMRSERSERKKPSGIQIGRSDDVHEREADRMADRVMRMESPSLALRGGHPGSVVKPGNFPDSLEAFWVHPDWEKRLAASEKK